MERRAVDGQIIQDLQCLAQRLLDEVVSCTREAGEQHSAFAQGQAAAYRDTRSRILDIISTYTTEPRSPWT